MKTSSSKNKRNTKYKNDFNTAYSSGLNETNLSSSTTCSASNKSTTSTSNGTSDIDLDAGENDPADELIYSFSQKSSPSTNNQQLQQDDKKDEDEEDEEKKGIEADDDYSKNDENKQKFINITATTAKVKKESLTIHSSDFNDDTNYLVTNNGDDSFMDKFDKDYDGQVEQIADKATDIISNGSFFNCGLYQFLSFLFVSIAWTVGNGWYAYVSVFSGYTPDFQCDIHSMNMSNLTQHPDDKECSALNIITNETIKCTKWIYDKSQLTSTIITEYDLVCDKNYYFELAYSIEQVGYIIGTLIFSFIADKIGRKPVFVGVIIGMSIFGIAQYFIQDLFLYFVIGFIINSLACGLEAVCVTLVLEMFSTSKRTFFGIGIEVVWVIILASMSPLAYVLQTWREIRLAIFFVLALLSLGSYWFVQESIRWLISVEKLDKANKIVNKIAKFNKSNTQTQYNENKDDLNTLFSQLSTYNKSQSVEPPKIIVQDSKQEQEAPEVLKTHPKRTTSQAIDIVKHPKFRLYVIIMALNWFATALVYDGLTYLNNYIGANIFFNWIAMNMIELPAQFVCYIVISRYGRRLTTSVTLVLVGFILLLTCLDSIDFVSKLEWFKLVLFVLAKFIITQSYSAVILHAPELFPTNLRSFGYGISLFSGKVTACISPMISIYLGKIYPILPSLIYGVISVVCGFISLYVPETLNRPLPNSIEDVIKWPRTLTEEEWKAVDELNKKEFDIEKVKKCLKAKLCCKKETLRKRIKPNNVTNNNDLKVIISASSSSLLNATKSNEFKINSNFNKSSTLPSSLSSSSANQNKKKIIETNVIYATSLSSSSDSMSTQSKFELCGINKNKTSSVNSFEA